MADSSTAEPVRRTVVVRANPPRAFELFTSGLGTWWPSEYTWAGEVLETIAIEPRAGGHCFERGPHGFRCDWGRVLVWEPPNRLVFTWQIAPDRVPEPNPERASEIEVRFRAERPGVSKVEFEHRDFARHGDGGAGYRDAMDSEYGWTKILARYVAAAE